METPNVPNELLSAVADIERLGARALAMMLAQGVTLDREHHEQFVTLLHSIRVEATAINERLQLLRLTRYHEDEVVRLDIERRLGERRVADRRDLGPYRNHQRPLPPDVGNG